MEIIKILFWLMCGSLMSFLLIVDNYNKNQLIKKFSRGKTKKASSLRIFIAILLILAGWFILIGPYSPLWETGSRLNLLGFFAVFLGLVLGTLD